MIIFIICSGMMINFLGWVLFSVLVIVFCVSVIFLIFFFGIFLGIEIFVWCLLLIWIGSVMFVLISMVLLVIGYGVWIIRLFLFKSCYMFFVRCGVMGVISLVRVLVVFFLVLVLVLDFVRVLVKL